MMPDQLLVDVPSRDHLTWRDWAALVVLIGLVAGIALLDHTAHDTERAANRAETVATAAKHASETNRAIGYRNRAAVCDFIREFGGVEPASCADPALRDYRDPKITASSGERRTTTGLLCQILVTLKQMAPQCAGDG